MCRVDGPKRKCRRTSKISRLRIIILWWQSSIYFTISNFIINRNNHFISRFLRYSQFIIFGANIRSYLLKRLFIGVRAGPFTIYSILSTDTHKFAFNEKGRWRREEQDEDCMERIKGENMMKNEVINGTNRVKYELNAHLFVRCPGQVRLKQKTWKK